MKEMLFVRVSSPSVSLKKTMTQPRPPATKVTMFGPTRPKPPSFGATMIDDAPKVEAPKTYWKGNPTSSYARRPYKASSLLSRGDDISSEAQASSRSFTGVMNVELFYPKPGVPPKDDRVGFKWGGFTFWAGLPQFVEGHIYQVLAFSARLNSGGQDFTVLDSTVKVTPRPLTVQLLIQLCDQFASHSEHKMNSMRVMTVLNELRNSSYATQVFADPIMVYNEGRVANHHVLRPEGLACR